MKIGTLLSGLVLAGALIGSGCGSPGSPSEMTNDPTKDPGGGMTVDYPKGDIGFKEGQQVINMNFLWHPNGLADKGSELQKISMADFYAKRQSGAKVLFLSGAAEWCGPCMIEARLISALLSDKVYNCGTNVCTCAPVTMDEATKYTCDFCQDLTKKPASCKTYKETLKDMNAEKAVELVQVVLQDKDRNRSDRDALERWETAHKTNFPVGIDPKSQISQYIPENAVPQSLWIRLKDMVLIKQEVGTPSDAPALWRIIFERLSKAN